MVPCRHWTVSSAAGSPALYPKGTPPWSEKYCSQPCWRRLSPRALSRRGSWEQARTPRWRAGALAPGWTSARIHVFALACSKETPTVSASRKGPRLCGPGKRPERREHMTKRLLIAAMFTVVLSASALSIHQLRTGTHAIVACGSPCTVGDFCKRPCGCYFGLGEGTIGTCQPEGPAPAPTK
jgi:hypothetical protein